MMGPIGCPETTVKGYHSMRNIQEKRRSVRFGRTLIQHSGRIFRLHVTLQDLDFNGSVFYEGRTVPCPSERMLTIFVFPAGILKALAYNKVPSVICIREQVVPIGNFKIT
jgi:hypothetical protein